MEPGESSALSILSSSWWNHHCLRCGGPPSGIRRVFQRRIDICHQYTSALASLPITLPAPEAPETVHSRHLYPILIDATKTGLSRDEFLERFTREGIGVGVHYLSLPEHPFYRERFGWRPEEYPNAMKVGRETVSLPLGPKLSDGDVRDVVEGVRRAVGD